MPLDPLMVARKLKQALELQSLSVSAVSEATGIVACIAGFRCEIEQIVV